MSLQCEVHEGCTEPVVAQVGLPRATAKWACEEGFHEFQGNPRCASTVGTGGLRCALRAGHEDMHRSGTTTWNQ